MAGGQGIENLSRLGWKAGQIPRSPAGSSICAARVLVRLGRGTGGNVQPPQLGQDAEVAEGIVILERAH